MTTLAQLQTDFFAAIMGEHPTAVAGASTYRRQVFANWHAALAATFPVVRRLVGDAFFREATRRFGLEHPSVSGDLNQHGVAFPAFLATYPFARDVPYLHDVARLEWACHEAFHAADAPRFDAARLAAIPAERHGDLRFRLHPSVRLVCSAFPIMAIWDANQPERDGTPRMSVGGEHVLVRRETLAVRLRSVPEPEWKLLQSLACGQSLTGAIDLLGRDAALVPSLLASLAADGVLAGVVDPESGA